MRATLLSISAYARPPSNLPGLDSPDIEATRAAFGGQLSPLPQTRTRWYLHDLEAAEFAADAGDLLFAGQLMAAVDRDGVQFGVMSTRCGGLVALPKRFRGAPDMVDALQSGGDQARSVFDEMLPPGELEAFASDIVKLNVAVAELVPIEGRDHPVFVRRLPEFLSYRWAENRWYFRSAAGLIEIKPGDGRWVLFVGGAEAPWRRGAWRAIGKAYIRKDHAGLRRDNWEASLANPARVAVAPQGATEDQKVSWFKKVIAWGVNTVFSITPGYDVKVLESNGRGADSWVKTIAEQDREYMIAIAGQTVTTDGGVGFANANIHKSIRADLIKKTADALALTINTQVLPAWVLNVFGEGRIADRATVEWDVTPPQDRTAEASALSTAATAITQLTDALKPHSLEVDATALATRFGVPIKRTDAGVVATGAKPELRLVKEAA